MHHLVCESASVDGVTIVSLRGEVDVNAASYLRSALEHAANGIPLTVLILDLAEVTFIDSVGLGLIVEAFKRSQEVGAEIRLRNPNRMVDRLLTITNLNAFIPVEHPTDG